MGINICENDDLARSKIRSIIIEQWSDRIKLCKNMQKPLVTRVVSACGVNIASRVTCQSSIFN